MLYGPITESSIRQHYSEVRQRLGLSRKRQVSTTGVRGVHYEFRAINHRRREFMIIGATASTATSLVDDGTETVPKWKAIAAEVADKAGISLAALVSKSRRPRVVHARQEACYRIHTETTLSMNQIAAKFGYCDHSVVHHCINKHKERLEAAGL